MDRLRVVIGLTAVLLATGCGASPGSPSSGDLGSGPANPTAAQSVGTVPSSQLKLAGTYTESAASTTLAISWQVGPIQYSPPPAAVLSACGATDPVTVSAMAYSPGAVTIGYTQGSLVEQVLIQTTLLISGDNWQGVVAFDIGGSWTCQQDDDPIYLDVSPHSEVTYPVWIMSQVLTNAQPRVSPAEADSWQVTDDGIGLVGDLYPTVTASGPGAARCAGTDLLMLYARSPSTITDPQSGQPDRCRPV